MSVLFVTELAMGSARLSVDGGRITHEYRRVFQVLFSSDHSLATILIDARTAVDPDTGLAVPLRGQAHPADPFSFVRNSNGRHAEQDKPHIILVDVAYSSADVVQRDDPREPTQDPLAVAPELEINSNRTEEATLVDRHGNPIMTANGESYSIPRDRSRPIISVRKPLPLTSLPAILNIQDVINDEQFTINIDGLPLFRVLPYQGKLTNFRAKLMRGNGFTYWDFYFELHIRPDPGGWRPQYLHQGTRERFISGDDELILQAVDDDGEYTTRPILLDASGFRLADGADPFYQEWEIYPEIDFVAVGL